MSKVEMTGDQKFVIVIVGAAAIAFAVVVDAHTHWSLLLLGAIFIFSAHYFFMSHPESPRGDRGPQTKRQKAFRLIGQASGIALLVSWTWIGLREMNYVGWSRLPQPEIGLIVPHIVKGIRVFISQQDDEFDGLLTRICLGSGLLFAIGIVLSGELSKIINPKPTLPPLS
jgi:hypothetical protein